MINRILIRSKVVQIAYSYFLTKDKTVMEAEKELFFSFEKSYELYHLLLTLMVELTDTQAARVEAARMKFLATPEEKNPNMRFVNNRFVEQLRNCNDYKDYHEKKPVTWTNDPEFLRDFSERIVKSDFYKEYMEAPEDSYENDCEFWKKVVKNMFCSDEELLALLPMFKDDDDSEFAKELFRNTLLHGEEYRNYIENFIRNWEIERVAFMDIVIMMVAMSEFYKFPSIPTRVTLNEYIELAKSYSTNKSGQFVNGVLNAIADNLKKEGVLTKE